MRKETLITICGQEKKAVTSHGHKILVSGYECSCGHKNFMIEGQTISMNPNAVFWELWDIHCMGCCSIYQVPVQGLKIV